MILNKYYLVLEISCHQPDNQYLTRTYIYDEAAFLNDDKTQCSDKLEFQSRLSNLTADKIVVAG